MKAAMADGPRIPRRTRWVAVDAEDYPDLQVELWLNAPQRIVAAFGALKDDPAGAEAALRQVVLGHNGWTDSEGRTLPPPHEEAFWQAIPTEIALLILGRYLQEVAQLPNFLSAKLGSLLAGSAPATGEG
jgi:hypothetical protein